MNRKTSSLLASAVLVAAAIIGTEIFITAQAKPQDYQELLKKSKAATVQIESIGANGAVAGRGTGFGVSPSGLVVTAAHVVSFTEKKAPNSTGGLDIGNGNVARYYPSIRIITSDHRTLNVTPVNALSAENLIGDFTILQGTGLNLPSLLPMGSSSSVHEGDELTIWGFPFGVPTPTLIKATVAALANPFPPPAAPAVIFQGPNNQGMSGGPVIENKSGNVVGIDTDRIAGIGEELAKTRDEIIAVGGAAGIRLGGIDPNANLLAVINVLDRYLMSGMGIARPIDPVKDYLPKP